LFVLEEKAAKEAAASTPPRRKPKGETYALMVGISGFKDPDINPLSFAHQDAIDLTRLLESPRAAFRKTTWCYW
jgi:hypothetical protein